MEVLESLLKQLSKLKNIISNIKKLIVKGMVSIVFPIDRKLNNTSNNIEKSINTIKTELNGRKSIILLEKNLQRKSSGPRAQQRVLRHQNYVP